jgi:hypothetical protein
MASFKSVSFSLDSDDFPESILGLATPKQEVLDEDIAEDVKVSKLFDNFCLLPNYYMHEKWTRKKHMYDHTNQMPVNLQKKSNIFANPDA